MNKTVVDRADPPLPGFRPVPKTGVIYVMTEAAKLGFQEERALWSNLGQGAPETNPMPGAPARVESVHFTCEEHEYAPVVGLPELRDAVAALYNERYRKGKQSQYTRDNVAISAGGRLALTRLVSTIGRTNIGHFIPDYTAYEEILDSFSTFVPIPMLRDPALSYHFSPEQLEREILGRGLSAVVLSNPCNPTGSVVAGKELEGWVTICRDLECTLIVDEFYSHYLYDIGQPLLSAAEYVEDVNRDPVVLFDGLTKNWRYPGFRVCWTVGPASIIEALGSAASFIDGGCARPMQQAAVPLLAREIADQEANAIQENFGKKRQLMLSALRSMDIIVDPGPQGGFYCWGDLSKLPGGLNSGMRFFRRALEEKVIVVPGVFFDINPGKRRPDRASRFGHYARFSFGPPQSEINGGLERLKKIL